jgi:hypothetical protein
MISLLNRSGLTVIQNEKILIKNEPTQVCICGLSGKVLGFHCSRAWYLDGCKQKVESIKKLGEPKCKKDVQKLLGNINYLSRIISNLAGRVESFLPLVRLKHEGEFVWGTEQRMAFDKINSM